MDSLDARDAAEIERHENPAAGWRTRRWFGWQDAEQTENDSPPDAESNSDFEQWADRWFCFVMVGCAIVLGLLCLARLVF